MDKDNLKKHFSKSATTYDKNAALQREIEDKLIAWLTCFVLSPVRILDLGAGTASGSRKLSKAYPSSKIFSCDIAHGMMERAKQLSADERDSIFFLTADMEHMPFKSDSFDIVYSSAAAHWLTDLDRLLLCVRSVLKKRGTFCFSTFGDDTLEELNVSFDAAYKIIGEEPKEHVNRFAPFYEVFSQLRKAGFDDIKAEVQSKKVLYPTAMDVLKSLKAIGSHKIAQNGDHADGGVNTNFLSKDFFNRVLKIYERNFKEGNKVYATYEVYYFICRV